MQDNPDDKQERYPNTTIPAPSDLYSDLKIPERLLLGRANLDFALGFAISALLSLLCFPALGLTLILIPVLRATDEFKRYPLLMRGMMHGVATTLCIIAVFLVAEAIYYMIHNGYWTPWAS